MDSIHICGGCPLNGSVRVQGSKNAVLPILAATILVEGVSTLNNCPKITDVLCMIRLLQSIGCRVSADWESGRITVDAGRIENSSLPEDYVSRMRCSVVVMGALLGRTGRVSISYPGGCVIGRRPIDMHLTAFSKLGVRLFEQGNILRAWTEGMSGALIPLPFPSVGATENSILAAVSAKGETRIENAAREPEIGALCGFLQSAGAEIEREEGGAHIRIRGGRRLHSCSYRIPPDRIVAGTYLLGCMAAGGRVRIEEARSEELEALLAAIAQMGGSYICGEDGITLKAPKRPKALPYLKTAVYPGYPTDLQSQLLAALSVADGISIVEEDIFEDRFRIVPELIRMGADITVEGKRAVVRGVEALRGARVCAKELRGGAALCMAALAAKGESRIGNRHFIDRGYASLEADIQRLRGRV